jgi:magnesium transporter
MSMPQLSDAQAQQELEERICALLEAKETDDLRALLADQHPADIGDVLNRLPADDGLAVFRLLSSEQAADVLVELGPETTRELIKRLPTAEAAHLLDNLPMDDVVQILTEDVPEQQQELLAAMRPVDAAEARRLLTYPPQSAGRLMTDKVVRILPDMTAAQTIAYLRTISPETETVNTLYVCDPQGRLLGVVSLREVLLAPPERPVREIMETDIVAVSPQTDQEEVARLVARYDFLSLPIVAPDRQLLGIITVDDVIDILLQESTEDVLRFGAVEPGVIDQPYFTVPLLRIIRKRVGWLLLLFVAETFTGSVLRLFEDELSRVVALSFFIPLLIGTGGNTGAQTVSTLIRGLALGEIRLRDTWRVLARELGSGMLLGVLLSVVAFVRALTWGSSLRLALVVSLTIVAICTWANMIGALIPLIAARFKIDPAVVSAPLITTLVDATGLLIYFLIAKLLLGL